MKVATSWSTSQGAQAIDSAYQALFDQLGATPSFLVLSCTTDHDPDTLLQVLHQQISNTPLIGATSCLGVMTQSGFHGENGSGLGLYGMLDTDGNYGVGAAAIGDDPRQAAKQAVSKALIQANCPGEVPAMIWMSAAPGHEEALIEGIADVLGSEVPVAGGSAADNTVSGEWRQFANDESFSDAVVVAALFPSTEIIYAFHSGYEPTELKGIATKTEGRLLKEIDGKPAAKIYDQWAGGIINNSLKGGGNILADTTLQPFGRVAGYIGKIPYYQLSHPDTVTRDGGLTLFTDIEQGEELILMRGSPDSLISRAGRVASSALDTYNAKADDVAGALVIYCAGCMLTVQSRIDEVVSSVCDVLPETPFLGAFTFGEQGCFIGGENRHGNLMISHILFLK